MHACKSRNGGWPANERLFRDRPGIFLIDRKNLVVPHCHPDHILTCSRVQIRVFIAPPPEPRANRPSPKAGCAPDVPAWRGSTHKLFDGPARHIIDEFDRCPELRSGPAVTAALFDEIDNSPPDFNRMRLTQAGPPLSASCTGTQNSCNLNAPNSTNGNTL